MSTYDTQELCVKRCARCNTDHHVNDFTADGVYCLRCKYDQTLEERRTRQAIRNAEMDYKVSQFMAILWAFTFILGIVSWTITNWDFVVFLWR